MASAIMVQARKIAEYTALGAATTPMAPTRATAPRIQNATASAVDVRVSVSAASSVIVGIINALTTLIPIIVKEAQDLAPIVKNVIAALRGNGSITTDQLDQLDAMEATLDAGFDASSTKADAEDAAATTGNNPAS